MSLAIRFPAAAGATKTDVGPLLASLRESPTDGPLRVGDARAQDFLVDVSKRLLDPTLARRHPELASLGFFLRRGELVRAIERLRAGSGQARSVPRGLIVHFPPANVDTIFLYSWALAALAGNANVVRLSTRSGPAAATVLQVLEDALADAHPVIAQTQRVVTYGHDDATTAALSVAADLRVIWGGDRSVAELRRFPTRPSARDLAFPDRASFAAISIPGWMAAHPDQRAAAADGFVNDLFWFDQAACSSPRALFWVGDTTDLGSARAGFLNLLRPAIQRRGWHVDPAMAVQKHVSTYGLAASGAATRVTFAGNALANVELRSVNDLQREWLGAGVVCHVSVASLAEVVPFIERKDQTLSQFGLSRDELEAFVSALAGRGIDRIVPFGQALTFASVWDGYDLLREFTRLVSIQV